MILILTTTLLLKMPLHRTMTLPSQKQDLFHSPAVLLQLVLEMILSPHHPYQVKCLKQDITMVVFSLLKLKSQSPQDMSQWMILILNFSKIYFRIHECEIMVFSLKKTPRLTEPNFLNALSSPTHLDQQLPEYLSTE